MLILPVSCAVFLSVIWSFGLVWRRSRSRGSLRVRWLSSNTFVLSMGLAWHAHSVGALTRSRLISPVTSRTRSSALV